MQFCLNKLDKHATKINKLVASIILMCAMNVVLRNHFLEFFIWSNIFYKIF